MTTRCNLGGRSYGLDRQVKPATSRTARTVSCRAAVTAFKTSRDSKERASASAASMDLVASLTKCAATAALGAFIVAFPGDALAANLEVGAQVFNGNCAACHAGGNNVIMAEKTLRKEALEQYLEGGFSEEAIIYQVENGKGAMPAWADRLSEEEIQSVAAYVYDTASKNGWVGLELYAACAAEGNL